MTRVVLASVLLALLCSCSNAILDLKSPCVGSEGSPCDRRPANDGGQA